MSAWASIVQVGLDATTQVLRAALAGLVNEFIDCIHGGCYTVLCDSWCDSWCDNISVAENKKCLIPKEIRHLACGKQLDGVADGARTHDNRNHNPDFLAFAPVDWR